MMALVMGIVFLHVFQGCSILFPRCAALSAGALLQFLIELSAFEAWGLELSGSLELPIVGFIARSSLLDYVCSTLN